MENKTKRNLLLSIIVSIFFISLHFLGLFEFIEYKIYDLEMKISAKNKVVSEEISVVLLDQDSINWAQEEFGWSWPWPRKAYGDIVNFFNLAKSDSLAFDVLFTEPSVYGTEDDLYFAKACENFGKILQVVFFESNHGNETKIPENAKKNNIILENYENSSIKINKEKIGIFPITDLTTSAYRIANASSVTDKDGIIRRYNLFTDFNNNIVLPLGLSMLYDPEENIISLNDKKNKITFCNKKISIDNDNTLLLRYKQSLNSYAPYSAKDILSSYYDLKSGKEPLLKPEYFTNNYVFFGFYAPGLFDICATPLSTQYPGVGVHITALDNFLLDEYLQKLPNWISILIIIIFSFIGSFTLSLGEKLNLNERKNSLLSISILILTIIFSIIIIYNLFNNGLWLKSFSAIMSLIFSFFLAIVINYLTEGKQKRYIKMAFKQYLSPIVIEEIIANPNKLKLGGEKKEISIFFSDIEGFTSISENLSPENLILFLNSYLSAITDIILESGGTIDKYEGDAIIAFWNAPIELENHSKIAIETALKCQKKLEEINPKLQEITNKPIFMRIGINTGEAIVGNMGSNSRFDYTMIGDSVNLASRLEGLNKQFGTYTMCSEFTKNKIDMNNNSLEFRELGKVNVIGKKEVITIYEPLTKEDFISIQPTIEKFYKGLNNFYDGNFYESINHFSEIENIDICAKKYKERCIEYMTKAPSNWNGIWIANSK